MMKIRKAVFPAAGLGTRFLPATKAQPKEMLPLVDKPIIQYVIEEAAASGITSIIIVTGRGKNAIEDEQRFGSVHPRCPRYASITMGLRRMSRGAPAAMMRPSASTNTRVHSAITNSIWCSMTTNVALRSA